MEEYPGPSHGTETVNNESWNGTSWTEQNNMLTARAAATGTGISTAALAVSMVQLLVR